MTLQDTANEVETLLLAIKENLHEEGLHKVDLHDHFHLRILDNPAYDYALMVFDGKIILTIPIPQHSGPNLRLFDLADPEVFQKVKQAVWSYHGP